MLPGLSSLARKCLRYSSHDWGFSVRELFIFGDLWPGCPQNLPLCPYFLDPCPVPPSGACCCKPVPPQGGHSDLGVRFSSFSCSVTPSLCVCALPGAPHLRGCQDSSGPPPPQHPATPLSPPVSCGSVSCGPAVCLLPAFLPSYPILHPCQKPQPPAHLPACPGLCVLGPLGLRSGVSGQPSSPCVAQTGPGRGAQNLNEGLWVRRREGALEKLEKGFSWPRLCRAVPTQAHPWVRTEERRSEELDP